MSRGPAFGINRLRTLTRDMFKGSKSLKPLDMHQALRREMDGGLGLFPHK